MARRGIRAGRRPARRGLVAALLAALIATAAAATLIVTEPMPVRAARDLVFDTYQRLAPRPYDPTAPVRVIDIDEESLARIGQWPWPRETLAQLVERLHAAGAATVALDILLSEPERTGGLQPGDGGAAPGDRRLAAALGEANAVVSVALADRDAPAPTKAGIAAAGDAPQQFVARFPGAILSLPIFIEAARGVAALNWIPDRDLIVRRVPTLLAGGDTLVPTLGIEALRVAQGASTFVIKASNASGETGFGQRTGIVSVKVGQPEIATERDGSVRVRYAGTHPERRIAAWRVFDPQQDLSAVDGAILLVGASAAALADVRATPLEAAVPGVDIHAEVIEHVLAGHRLARPDYAAGAEIVIALVACLAVAALATLAHPLLAAAGLALLVAGIAGGSWLSFLHRELLIDPGLPITALAVTFGSTTVAALRRSESDKRRTREAFGRYVSPAVVAALAADPSRLSLGGEIRPLTVLFADVRGFTSRAETMSAEEVVRFLNAIHTPLADEVMRFNGTIDKFMGDGLMAFWNAPLDEPDHVRLALQAALAMQRAVVKVDEQFSRDHALPAGSGRLAIGIGVHTGPACVGNMGSVRRFDYSAVGDSVNTAARIEQATKTYGMQIVVSEDVKTAAPQFAYLLVDTVKLRGRRHETRLFALVGEGGMTLDETFLSFRERHDAAIAAALAGADDAFIRLAEMQQHPMGRGYATLYAYHWDRLKDAPPRPAPSETTETEIIY